MKGSVRVHVGGAGEGVRVALYIHQFMASGMTKTVVTNSQGDAYIEVDTDAGADAEVWVGSEKRVSRSAIKDTYYV